MNNRKKYKDLSYLETVQKIEELKNAIEKHNAGRIDLPDDFLYRQAVVDLSYLRNRARSLKNKS